MLGDEIIDITNLPERMKENKQAYAAKLSLNKYHELLEQNKILPIDLKTEGNLTVSYTHLTLPTTERV